ncbi:hypothetical protein FACS189472_17690 [Alphaproteobacteria bacterium]|nr:hypothetical protein FACS189472_17690 [Alphaproteobacteria bacterium]
MFCGCAEDCGGEKVLEGVTGEEKEEEGSEERGKAVSEVAATNEEVRVEGEPAFDGAMREDAPAGDNNETREDEAAEDGGRAGEDDAAGDQDGSAEDNV